MTLTRRAFSLALALCAAPALAEDVPAPGDAEAGRDLYRVYCSTCHGDKADGTGPTSDILTVPPSNLTRLAAAEGGTFPTARVVMRIDGRDEVVAHGLPMPIFGPFFEGDDTALKAPNGQPILTSRPIADLLAYIMSIQVD